LQDASANGLNLDDVQTRLSRLARQYRLRLQADPAHARAPHVHRIGRLHREHGVLVDLGGGVSLHNGVLAQLGMHAYVVDLLGEYWERKASEPTSIDHEVGVLAAHGVQFIRQEISTCDLTQHFADNSVDVVTTARTIAVISVKTRLAIFTNSLKISASRPIAYWVATPMGAAG
jgi:hypothetical protein